MPLIRASLCSDNDRAAVRARSVCIELRGADGELLHGIGRVVLQESADVVVVVVSAVDGEVHIQPGAARKRNGRGASLGRVGRLHRLRHRTQISNVGETPMRERNLRQILRRDCNFLNAAGGLDGLRGERRRRFLHLDSL